MNSNGRGIMFRLIYLAVIFLASLATQAFAQIYHVKEMNTEQIKALDREKTVVIFPVASLNSTALICRRFPMDT